MDFTQDTRSTKYHQIQTSEAELTTMLTTTNAKTRHGYPPWVRTATLTFCPVPLGKFTCKKT